MEEGTVQRPTERLDIHEIGRRTQVLMRRDRWKWLAIFALAAISAGRFGVVLALRLGAPESAPSSRHVIRAARFVVVDSSGADVAELGAGTNRGVGLRIASSAQSAELWVGVGDGGRPSVSILDSAGRPLSDLTLWDGMPRLALRVPGKGTRLGLLLSKDGRPRLDLFSEGGKVTCSLSEDRLCFFDSEGQEGCVEPFPLETNKSGG